MAEKFHNDADKMVYRPRRLEVEQAPEPAHPEVEAAPEPVSTKKTPAKSASTKKES